MSGRAMLLSIHAGKSRQIGICRSISISMRHVSLSIQLVTPWLISCSFDLQYKEVLGSTSHEP
jgi:hypothetical protein